jgi:hypothetical protein
VWFLRDIMKKVVPEDLRPKKDVDFQLMVAMPAIGS